MLAEYGKWQKDERTLQMILAVIEAGDAAVLMGEVADLLQQIVAAGGVAALEQVGIEDDERIVNLVNENAVAYAQQRAAELVGKQVQDDGTVVDNPSPSWRIDEATRDMIRGDVAQALEEGWSNDRLADALAQNYGFSDERSELIARTETAFADVQGNLTAYRESGLVAGKQWIVGAGCCDECEELRDVIVALDEDFPNGAGDGPPYHPACRCDVVPVLADDTEE